MSTEIKCPVCGKAKGKSSVPIFDCNACGFPNAYVEYFASPETHRRWLDSVRAAAARLADVKEGERLSSLGFWLGSNTAAFADTGAKRLTVILPGGRLLTEQNAVGFSAGDRNCAVLYDNGTVRVFGEDNSFGQKNTEDWKDITSVLSAPNCTFGITKDGRVVCAGSPGDRGIGSWHGIRMLRSGSGCIVGLRTDGKVQISGSGMASEALNGVNRWTEPTDIAVSKDCVIGLTAAGRVEFAGKANDPRNSAAGWQNITAIAADDCFVYGLTKEGTLLTAGTCKPLFDKGRSGVREWKNIVRISAGGSCIGAMDKKGELLFAGYFTGDFSRVRNRWNTDIIPQIMS